MIVITLTDCPPKLRGDLTKWLCEINTGVYVGQVSARVREALWTRICEHLKTGRATMVYPAANEQGMAFHVWHSTWEPVDFDGITLMRHPLAGATAVPYDDKNNLKSKASIRRMVKRKNAARRQLRTFSDYTVIDLETTGLDIEQDAIIEFGALRVRHNVPEKGFSQLVRTDRPLSPDIIELTGITPETMLKEGTELKSALTAFLKFIGKDRLLIYNAHFDMGFLMHACQTCGIEAPTNTCVDVMKTANQQWRFSPNYKLETLATFFDLPQQAHRALDDCELTHQVYQKLNENGIQQNQEH